MTDRRVTEDYAETVTKTDVQRKLSEDYAEAVTVWLKMRLLTENYAEAVTPADYAARAGAGFDGWGIPI